MVAAIRFILSNLTLTLLVIGVLAALLSMALTPSLAAPRIVEALPFYFLILSIGTAAGHLSQMARAVNFAPGNSGVMLYTDVLIAIVGFVLLWLQHRYGRPAAQK